MSIKEQIDRINTEKKRIATKTTQFGLTDNDTANLKTLADAIDGIEYHECVDVNIPEGGSFEIVPGYHRGGMVYAVNNPELDAAEYALETGRVVIPLKNSDQTIVKGEGFYGLGAVVVKKIPDPYYDVSNVTAIGPDVLETSWFIDKDGILQQGTMTNKSGWKETLSLSKTSVDVPFGFHNGGGSVSISLDDAREVTPNEGTQSIIPPTGKVLSVVTVKPIPTKYKDLTNQTITADDVLNTAKFIDKETGEAKNGAISDLGEVNEVLSPDITRSDPLYTVACQIPKGYHNGKGSVSALVSNTYEATPSETKQTIVANSGSFMGQFTVQPIPTKYKDLTEQTITANDVLSTKKFIDKETGEAKNGKIDIYENLQHTLDTSYGVELGGNVAGYLNSEFTIPKGYHNGTGKVKIIVEEKEVTPTESLQTVVGTPAVATQPGKVLGAVKVKPIPSQYKDITNQLLQPNQVLKGGRFIDKTTGQLTYGTIENLQEVKGTINTYSQTGYYLTSGGHFDAISIELDNSDLIAKLQEI